MTSPVSSAATANGTMAYQPVTSIAIQAAPTVCASWLAAAQRPSARYATTAPIQPTEVVRWTVSASLRTPGAMVTAASGLLHRQHRGRRLASGNAGAAGRHVAHGAVLTAGDDHHPDEQHDHGEDD